MARKFGLGLTLFLCLCGLVAAQETTGGLVGTVVDPSGAAVPNAKVEISGTTLVRTVTTSTDATGAFRYLNLPPGTYVVTISASGFSTVKRTEINIVIGRNTRIDQRMEVGAVTESVFVAADAIMVDTTSNSSSTNVERSFFNLLPRGRNFDSLLAIAPGARPEIKGGGYQIDGASGSENVFFINGMDVTNIQTGVLNRNNQIPFEFVQEVQIKSGGLNAEYGGAIGGAINAVLRSGSNDFHGQVGLFTATDGMYARPRPTLQLSPRNDAVVEYFQNTRDGYRLLNPAIQVGGRIVRDKLWFFAGFMPEMHRTERTVNFQSGQTGTYVSRERQDYMLGKIDYAPLTNLRTTFSYLYNPNKVNGLLPNRQGTDAFSTPWAQRGSRTPTANYTYQADWLVNSHFVLSGRGGYNYRNFADYGIPRGTRYRYANPNLNMISTVDGQPLPVPAQFQGTTGNFTPDNRQTVLDKYTRGNINIDGTITFNAAGQHTVKAGWQLNQLHNEANAGSWPDGYIFIYWNRDRTSAIGANLPVRRGRYGYYIDRFFATAGDVSSNNHSIFFQDTWRVNRNLTLNLGVRTEREFVPSYRTDSGIASRAITFGFGQKFAPRIGFAWDPTGVGKWKIYGSWGMFYDLMKFELPRGSFGGDKWIDKVYTLESAEVFGIKPGAPPSGSRLIETVDWRIPSNDPSDNTIDPNLRPMRSRLFDMGVEHSISSTLVASIRYAHRVLDRTIEDVGTLTPAGEKYYIANPGFGLVANPNTWEKGVPPTPKAVRDYDAIEFRLDKRFSKNYQFAASYTWSRLYGNYGGLASSDENGRTSPNVNRYFDLPFMSFDERAQLVYGRLATDRPHTLKFFGGYTYNSKMGATTFAPNVYAYSGTPLTSEVGVFGVPVFSFGRGDLGRSPFYSNFDLNVYHDFKPVKSREQMSVRIEGTVFNLFNQSTVNNKNVGVIHPNDGNIEIEHHADFFKGFNSRALITAQKLRYNPQYGLASGFQGPRTMRFQFTFFF